eukprot:Seg868.2 transcript_id=Seg868.2/GoldUCD/mRNA.D3Y31 product="Rhamnosyl O-methyltransferase" protein_id=Seg868.2/GoldUCD/D3Y31
MLFSEYSIMSDLLEKKNVNHGSEGKIKNADYEFSHVHDDTDYVTLIEEINKQDQSLSEEGRFFQIQDRKRSGTLQVEMMKNICHGKYLTTWKGINLMKDPIDMVIYQQLLWREKPKAIFEIGAYTGACAVWMADTMRSYGIDCHVYSVDINFDLIDARAKSDKNVTFTQGDVTKIDQVYSAEFLKDIPHPWLVSEDAHVDLTGVMEHFGKYMQKGDYFIIEDTNPDSPLISGQGLLETAGEYEKYGPWKLDEMEKFLKSKGDTYAVDSFYTDFFGYNGTYNWNGFIRKMV